MLSDPLNQLVFEYQLLAANRPTQSSGGQCPDERINTVYSLIKSECASVITQLDRRFRGQGVSADDESDEKLMDCIAKFPQDATVSFKAYFRVALSNRLLERLRACRRERLAIMEHQQHQSRRQSSEPDTQVFGKQLERYRIRKRRLLDQLRLTPKCTSTLLLDQRGRMAALGNRFGDFDYGPQLNSLSDWVAWMESWTRRDQEIQLAPGCVRLSDVWLAFCPTVDSRPGDLASAHLLQAISQAGAIIDPVTWRQRVSRYLSSVRDQVDEDEWKLFHSTLYRSEPN